MSKIFPPLNFQKWIDENREKLKPPVCNQVVWQDTEYIIMVVGGPNIRKDYHYNQTPEFFYQLEGNMVLKVIDDGEFKDVAINEGEIFVLPARAPHSPQRFENSVGLVVETKRPKTMLDQLHWYCESCGNQLFKKEFHLTDIVHELKIAFDEFYNNETHRTCDKCNTVMDNVLLENKKGNDN